LRPFPCHKFIFHLLNYGGNKAEKKIPDRAGGLRKKKRDVMPCAGNQCSSTDRRTRHLSWNAPMDWQEKQGGAANFDMEYVVTPDRVRTREMKLMSAMLVSFDFNIFKTM
jgi:hypothetical protein